MRWSELGVSGQDSGRPIPISTLPNAVVPITMPMPGGRGRDRPVVAQILLISTLSTSATNKGPFPLMRAGRR